LDDLLPTEIAPRAEVWRNENFVHFGGSADFPPGLAMKKRWMEGMLGISRK